MEAVDNLINVLRAAQYDARADIKKQLLTLALGDEGSRVREYLDHLKKGELLEIQWEIEDVLEESAPAPINPPTPEPEPEPEPEPAEPDPNAQLTAADLEMVYDDPRGFMLHKSKVGNRWFATQVDPQTGPQTFELHAQEIEQIKGQLQGSPYWLIGS
ncbi:MAG: hypothetical protein CL930_01660 [Deltaproteobacteria bacterium]|nr:hypothetical protein [Deltaproteobacteria bacterium]|tara:strand:+ start:1006 stop:1479 length:474 start_codon:yes stop_codon:yes gene_type:complete